MRIIIDATDEQIDEVERIRDLLRATLGPDHPVTVTEATTKYQIEVSPDVDARLHRWRADEH